jgi:glycosyltransferase involved in cell wall biosynthesis
VSSSLGRASGHNEARMKVLIVAFYFPPAGGAGVWRPLKLATHLSELGYDVHVLAPDDPKWLLRDESVALPPAVQVHRARNLGPRARRPAEELYGRTGAERLALQAQLAFRRVLVPDASVLWNLTAVPAAVRLVRREGIDVVVTTSPPGSVHLVGAAAQSRTDVRWVADLRDSLAVHPHRRRAVRGERKLAELVARRANAVVCASRAIAEEMAGYAAGARLEVVENGADFEDFEGLAYSRNDRFRITHTGNFIGRRSPRAFLDALTRSPDSIVARFVGDFRQGDVAYAEQLGVRDRLELVPPTSHREALALQRDSEALLLLIPDAEGRGRGILSGKVFEYLAAARPILAAVPEDGEAAALLRLTGAGTVVAPEDVDGLAAALSDLEARWRAGSLDGTPLADEWRERLDRRTRAREFARILESLV